MPATPEHGDVMQFDPFQVVMSAVWAMPFWMKAAFVVLIVLRLCWPELFVERATSPRRWRRRRRRNWSY